MESFSSKKRKVDNKTLVLRYFEDCGEGNYECKCGTKRKKARGWSNLMDHITRDHPQSISDAEKVSTTGRSEILSDGGPERAKSLLLARLGD